MESVYNLAKKYYPSIWNRAMLDHLVEQGKLTYDEYLDIVGEEEEDE